MNCPNCFSPLSRLQANTASCGCKRCGGRWYPYAVFERKIGGADFRETISEAKISDDLKRKCPTCAKLMKSVATPENKTPIDVCTTCEFVWFDFLEFENFRGRDIEKRGRLTQPDAPTDFGIAKVQVFQTTPFGEISNPRFYESSVVNDRVVRGFPAITYISIAICMLVFTKYRAMVPQLWMKSAFIAGDHSLDAVRRLITSFFVHADWFHVLGNMYFLWIFGSDVEDDRSHLTLFTLLLGGHVVGTFAQGLISPLGTPIGGASAGVYAVMVYYSFLFPKARMQGIIPLFGGGRRNFSSPKTWLYWTMPIGAFVTIKVMIDFLQALTLQKSGIAFVAHVAGAIFGFLMASGRKPSGSTK